LFLLTRKNKTLLSIFPILRVRFRPPALPRSVGDYRPGKRRPARARHGRAARAWRGRHKPETAVARPLPLACVTSDRQRHWQPPPEGARRRCAPGRRRSAGFRYPVAPTASGGRRSWINTTSTGLLVCEAGGMPLS
jgi:hypothetical protein